ncbi:NAD(+)/NADH kinase [Candidatus Gracilibacteria bacterium 28_42_T64]|nr:NAD(+)/NADH kinase [Candidatus Gracilibacteria bacterium 28_42_T64]
MQYSKIHSHIICYSAFKYAHTETLKEFLVSQELEAICKNLTEQSVVVLGGDGTMLRAIKENYTKNLPFLGINLGNKGFLLNDKGYVTRNSTYKKEVFPIMECDIVTQDKKYSDIFINEANISAGGGKMLELGVELGKRNHFHVKGDGLLVVTPLGSTGYNTSLGGPIMAHSTQNLSITPKAIWLPKSQQSIIINDNEVIQLNNSGRCHSIEIYADGREIVKTEHETHITIIKSDMNLTLLIAKDYENIWDNKILG